MRVHQINRVGFSKPRYIREGLEFSEIGPSLGHAYRRAEEQWVAGQVGEALAALGDRIRAKEEATRVRLRLVVSGVRRRAPGWLNLEAYL